MPQCKWGGQRAPCGSQFSPSLRWALGIELRPLALVAASLPHELSHQLSFCFLSNCQRWQLKHHLDVHNPGDFAVRSTIQGIPKHPNNNIKKEKSSKDIENSKMITRSGSLRKRTDYTRSPSCLMFCSLIPYQGGILNVKRVIFYRKSVKFTWHRKFIWGKF